MKDGINPMHPGQRLANARRCSAHGKRSGHPCQSPAVTGWTVCRMHGAGGGAPSGPGNGNWRHGARSHEADALRRAVADLVGMGKVLAASFK